MKTSPENYSTDNTPRVGPGQRLKQAREQNNISADAIASRLHLRTEIIEAIENDDYSKTHSFVFVKGYIRAYAKILGLPGDELIQAFTQLGVEEPESKRTVRLRRNPELENQHRQWRWGALLTVVSLAIMGAIWWQANKNITEETPAPVAAATSPTPEAQKPSVTPAEQAPVSQTESAAVSPDISTDEETVTK